MTRSNIRTLEIHDLFLLFMEFKILDLYLFIFGKLNFQETNVDAEVMELIKTTFFGKIRPITVNITSTLTNLTLISTITSHGAH